MGLGTDHDRGSIRESLASPAGSATRVTAPVLDVVVPVHNEEADLEPCVRRVRDHLRAHFPYPFRITVADNPSTDSTGALAPRPVSGVPAGLTGQLIRFAAVGVASTLAYLLLYALLRLGVGPQWANFTALLVTAVGNTAVNRRVTFGVRGPDGAWRHHAQGLLVFAIGLALTSGSLALLGALSERPAKPVELIVLILANLLATAVRFLLLRVWVFRSRREPTRAR